MKENKYDNEQFFNQYKQMARSQYGLEGAGEWHEFKKMMPDFVGKKVLDLGCGFGWHCRYAAEKGAREVVGIDLSQKMLRQADALTTSEKIVYKRMSIEDAVFPQDSFDCVISSLAFHYIASFDDVCKQISEYIVQGGSFIFSVEHPVFTAEGSQQWKHDDANKLYWPVDNYYYEGERRTTFLGEEVVKYHRTLTSYARSLIKHGFEVVELVEPQPAAHMLEGNPEMQDEMRRPMMLLIKAVKK